MKNTPAGLSNLTRMLLRDMFISQDVSVRGIALEGLEQRVRISFHALIADEEALMQMWHITGHGGTCPCAITCSVVNKPRSTDMDIAVPTLAARSDLIQTIACSDVKKLGLKTDADVWRQADEVAASLGTASFKLKQQTRGITYHADAILFDIPLRRHIKPATCNRVDVMHVIFSNGVLAAEVMLFLQALNEKHGFYFKAVRDFLAPWRASKVRMENRPDDAFSTSREKSSGQFLKAGASELLSVYAGLRHCGESCLWI